MFCLFSIYIFLLIHCLNFYLLLKFAEWNRNNNIFKQYKSSERDFYGN